MSRRSSRRRSSPPRPRRRRSRLRARSRSPRWSRPTRPTSRRWPTAPRRSTGRPWLEFLMRPVRAGTSQDDAIVQFELTVGNTGDVAARDVRISTWMVAAGEGTDMERSLIEPPADAAGLGGRHRRRRRRPGRGGDRRCPRRAWRRAGAAGGGRRRPLPPARRQRGPHPRRVRDRRAGGGRARCRPSRPTAPPAFARMSRPASTANPNASDASGAKRKGGSSRGRPFLYSNLSSSRT